ncbi:AraC family transcriptional regulator [Paenibacillus sp. URB8-2]|uniref:AraC family transcriptional regulator n=1 Tax=Paenibacillus sp. URB8-2 TaxID=2741301 RepID=UPI0015B7F0E7|nr:helix-turn-helix domain-containing protein [Paenibacillus sp. URB8-2]BCG57590.1 DNA-binding transcriptional regulator AraC [Paenibacillus sp. URB8-2]
MSIHMDYMISPYPIRIIDPKVEASKLRLSSIRVGQVGHLPGRTLFRTGVTFTHWAFVYVVSGSGTYAENGGKRQQVRDGSLFFFQPGRIYDFGPPPYGSWDEYYINFTGNRVNEWREAGLLTEGIVFRADAAQDLAAGFERVLDWMEGGDPRDADRAALLLERMLLDCCGAGDSHRPDSEDSMQAIREDLHSCIYGVFDASLFARKHHISVSTLRRLVLRSSGYPLHDYIHRLKMGEAKKLLLNTPLQVQEISGMLRYNDPFYFSRLFKKYMGISPMECRCNV